MSKTRIEKLEDLRSVETLLWTRHREEQVFNLETYGAREYDSAEPTTYSQGAETLARLLDMVEDLLELADEDTAFYASHLPNTPASTYTVNMLQIIDEHLPDHED